MKRLLIFLSGAVCSAVCFATVLYAASSSSTHAMKREIIHIPNAPTSPLYSQAVKVGSTIWVTGILGLDPKTNQPAGPTIQEQTRQALINCESILHAAGAKLDNVVEVQVLLARPGDFAGMNEAYAKFFPIDPPTRTTTRLGPELPGMLVSIRMTAVLLD